jgi:hypothetical protein
MFHVVLSLIAHNEMALPAQWFFKAIDAVLGTHTLTKMQQFAEPGERPAGPQLLRLT